MYTPLHKMPSHSRVWIFQADRKLSAEEVAEINKAAKAFTDEWTSHKEALKASFDIRYDHFLILLIDEKVLSAGGCSIDESTRFVKGLEKEYGLSFFNRLDLAYWSEGQLKVLTREEFEKKMEKGEINEETIVFNNLVQSKIDLDTKWEVPLKHSWHKALLEV